MAQQVSEIMNSELFGVRTSEHAGDVLRFFVALGIAGAPVLDRDGAPVGFVSLRDLVAAEAATHVVAVMTVPVDTVEASASIRTAAERIAESGRHHLVAVDGDGRAVGFVSALDVVRGLLGRPVPHPEAFPHYDAATGLTWSNESQLTFAAIEHAPSVPGVFTLIRARAGAPNEVVWTEVTSNLRQRLRELLATPASAPPHLMDAAISGALWFRSATSLGGPALPP